MKLFKFTLLLLPFSSIQAAQHEIPTTEKTVALLGTGYNSEKEEFLGPCIEGTIIHEGKPQASIDLTSSISERELSKELGFSMNTKFRYGAVTASASAKYLKNTKTNSLSISTNYVSKYTFENRLFDTDAKLTSVGQSVQNHDTRWKKTCGDHYAAQQVVGAKLFFSIRLDFKSELAKRSFQANFNVSGPAFDVGGKIKNAKNQFSKETKVTVQALQIGGKVDKISQIFYGGTTGGNDAPFQFVQCSLGDLQKCEKVLANMIQYATDIENGFPSQIDPDVKVGENGGPALLKILARPYSDLGIYSPFSPEMTMQIKVARRKTSDLFEKVLGQFATAESLNKRSIVRLNIKQKERIVKAETTLWDSMQMVVDAAQICYTNPGECPSAYQSIDIGNPDSPVTLFDDEYFRILPETFSQYCDLALSPFGKKSLRESILGMIEGAKGIDEEKFNPSFPGQRIDTCSIAEEVFRNNTDVDLSGKNISDLRPLNQFTHFVSLNLSQNKIKSLNELSKLVNLTSLDLSENKISSPDPLSVLVGLQYLNLAGNEIIDTVSLESLGELTRLDLRNNSSDIKCPLEDDSICLTEDYSNTTSFVTIDRTLRIGRWGHQSIKLDDGRIFITGGFSTNSHEIDLKKSQASEFFNPTFNEFKKGKKMSFSRVYHSATKLRNGRVLLVGGFFSGNRIEIYDPKKNQFQVVATAPSLIARHEAIELKDGRVLITGGNSRFIDFEAPLFATARSYIFDPRDNSFNSIGSMNVPRFGHQMTMLNSGEVLITGGFDVTESLNSAEIFNPLTERFEAAPSRLKSHRGFHSALKMNNGNVVLLGGADKDAKAISSVEIFDHQTKSFQDQGDLLVEPRLRLNALKLNSGRIVVIGGGSQFISHYEDLRASSHCYKSGEILDLNKKLSTKLGDQMQDARCGATLNEIDSNHLLILGGRGAAPAYSASMFEFTKL